MAVCGGQTGRRTNRRRANQGHLLLTDILHEAPRVLQLVSPDDKKALLAVCKSVRRLVHAFACSVTLQEDDSLEHLLDTAVGSHLQQLHYVRHQAHNHISIRLGQCSLVCPQKPHLEQLWAKTAQ